ncbi:MAG: outer membrane beta-barrel protein [Tannerella sp.]|nr:outer membrane beta-barrel protein [Tannerella sp.]
MIAQVEVKGTIIEKGSKEPVEQAAVRLLNAKDSAFVGGGVSGKGGAFSIKNVKAGNYLLEASFIGYKSIFQELNITGRNKTVDAGQLEMSDDAILLDEFVVTAKAAEITVRNDTVEYNADSYKVTEGSVLEDLLKKMPGVEIDSEGKVTVNGKEIKKVMVDGKEFFSDDPKVASKNLPAKMVDKVQVLDKKSDMAMMTGFDDGDEETIINLTIKPGMKQGWFGNAFAGYGSDERYEGNFMVNRFINNDQFTIMGGLNNTNNMGFSDLASTMFSGMGGGRRGFGGFGAGNGITSSGNLGSNFSKEFSPKLVFGGNVRYSHSDNLAESKDNTQNILPGDSGSYDFSEARRNTVSDNLGVNLRLEWKPDSMTQIIFQPDISYSKTHSEEDENSHSLNGLMDTVNRANSYSLSDGDGYSGSARLEFSRKLNNAGRVISGSVRGGFNDSYSKGLNTSTTNYLMYGDSVDLIDQQVRYDNSGYNYQLYASWVEPLGHNNFLQATYRINQSKREALKNSYNNDGTGQYSELDTTYSKSTRNSSVEQRASIAFKSVRGKYNYTIGFNLDPSHSNTETFVGDNVLYSMSRNVLNYSPTAQLNYNFDKRTNLRVDYDGRTTQPSMQQLQPVADVSDPLNTTIGNPELNPTYTNNMRLRFQKFVPENQTAFMIFADGNYIINNIVSKSTYDTNTGKRISTYENVNGNYNGNIRVIFNTPLKNKKFSINSMTWGMYSNTNGFINGSENTSKALILNERAGINYRSDLFDFGLNGNIRYNQTKNTLQGQNNLNTYNYGGGASTTLYLPWHFQIESDITYSTNSGYTDGYQQKELLWNASASKSLFKNNSGTLRFKIYDILQQRSNISYSATASTIRYSEYNTLGSYFMVHFIYRFSIFSGGAKESDMRRDGPRFGGPGGGPSGPPPR